MSRSMIKSIPERGRRKMKDRGPGRPPEHVRWSQDRGSVNLLDQKLSNHVYSGPGSAPEPRDPAGDLLASLEASPGERKTAASAARAGCTADQKYRWLAAALLDIEPHLRRTKGYRALLLQRAALQARIGGKEARPEVHVA